MRLVDHALQDAGVTRAGNRRIVSKRVLYVELDNDGVTRHLHFRAVSRLPAAGGRRAGGRHVPLSVMVYSFARMSAVVGMRRQNYIPTGDAGVASAALAQALVNDYERFDELVGGSGIPRQRDWKRAEGSCRREQCATPHDFPPPLDHHDRARHVAAGHIQGRGAVHQRDRSGPAEERLTAQGSGLSCDTCRTPPPRPSPTSSSTARRMTARSSRCPTGVGAVPLPT